MSSTQQLYPGRASWRTAVQSALGVILTLGVVLPVVVSVIGDGMDAYLPDAWRAWLVGAAAFVAALSATLARVMAIPAVDGWLRSLGLSSTPGWADSAGVIVDPDVADPSPDFTTGTSADPEGLPDEALYPDPLAGTPGD
jgi:hypothetical protein